MNNILHIVICIIGIIAYFTMIPQIKQDQEYHNFADQRQLLGLPNYSNVLSNGIFLLVGLDGIFNHLLKGKKVSYNLLHSYMMPIIYFIGVIWTCFGSAYYHYNPNNTTLVWDRLPMSVAFMSLLSLILDNVYQNKIYSNFIVRLLFIAVGIISVLYWSIYDDLKPYILVQFGSIIYVITHLWGKRKNLTNVNKYVRLTFNWVKRVYAYEDRYYYLCLGIFWYLVAKLLEFTDMGVFNITSGFISGHALKHITAGFGAYYSGLYVIEAHKMKNREAIIMLSNQQQ